MTIDDVALTMEREIDHNTAVYLLEIFGSAAAIYSATEEELVCRAELKPQLAKSLTGKLHHRRAGQELAHAARYGITPVASTDPQYPTLLRECNDYPHVLYYKGDTAALSAPMLSMVGTRRVNTYALSVCNKLITELAQAIPELVIVSGLAFGVDIACHRAALACGLRTVGVMATPANTVYPSAHSAVAADMAKRGGGVATELSSQDKSGKWQFLRRNRIIAGMSAGTVVVQSPMDGGSMITASLTDGYNRTLMAPPANIGEKLSEGTNMLIRANKARMICSAADIMEELGWKRSVAAAETESAPPPDLTPAQQRVYDCICKLGKPTFEEIAKDTGIGLGELPEALLDLEFAGFIIEIAGDRYEKFKI